MGNSSASRIKQISNKQLLLQSYSLFDVPQQYESLTFNNDEQCNSEQLHKVVHGTNHPKALFYLSPNFILPTQCSQELQLYSLRHQSQDAQFFSLVRVLAAKQMHQSSVCSSYYWYCIITQHLTLFDQIQAKFSYEDLLFIFFNCLWGFFYLYSENGPFPVTEKMIGINDEGKPKLWLSQNFAINHPQNSTIELYVNRNFTTAGQVADSLNHRAAEKKMIRQILAIMNSKYQDRSPSFSETLQTNISRTVRNISIEEMTFQELLKVICEYEEKCQHTLFIPNVIRLQNEVESRLPQRERFSIKLQRAINEYRYESRSNQEEMKSNGRTTVNAYSTGVDGNTLRKYVPIESGVQNSNKKPQVKFSYQEYGLQNGYLQGSGLIQSGYFLNQNISHFNFSQYHKDYSVRDAQSEVIGIRRSEFVQRMQEFTNQSKSRNIDFVNHSYVPGEYEQEIQSMSKDMRDTYFKSTKGSIVERHWTTQSNSFGEKLNNLCSVGDNIFLGNEVEGLRTSSSELKLVSSELTENLTAHGRQKTTPSSLAPSNVGWRIPASNNSTYKKKEIDPYLYGDSKDNFIRIPEEAQQESYRPSMMSINVEGKSSLDKLSYGQMSSERDNKMSPQFLKERISSPIIESRFTENARPSSEYVEKPFSVAYNTGSGLYGGGQSNNRGGVSYIY